MHWKAVQVINGWSVQICYSLISIVDRYYHLRKSIRLDWCLVHVWIHMHTYSKSSVLDRFYEWSFGCSDKLRYSIYSGYWPIRCSFVCIGKLNDQPASERHCDNHKTHCNWIGVSHYWDVICLIRAKRRECGNCKINWQQQKAEKCTFETNFGYNKRTLGSTNKRKVRVIKALCSSYLHQLFWRYTFYSTHFHGREFYLHWDF